MARIRMYSNTGFNPVDIPDDPSILTHGSHEILDYNDYNIQSCEGLTTLKCKINGNDALEVDYIRIQDNDGNECLYINMGVRPIAPGTYEFALEPNALSTILEDITILSAVAERMHVSDDDDTFYPGLEPFEQSEPTVLGYTTLDYRFPDVGRPECTNILETVTIPPVWKTLANDTSIGDNTTATQRVYGSTQQFANEAGPEYKYTTGASVTLKQANEVSSQSVIMTMQPEFRQGQAHTQVGLINYQSEVESTSIDVGSYYWINNAQQVVNDLKALGADSSVSNHWAVPTVYLGQITDGGYSRTGAATGVSRIGSTAYHHTFMWGAETIGAFKNNKVLYGQANTFTAYSPVSGSRITKMAYEVRDPGVLPGDAKTTGLACSYVIGVDIRPEGAPNFHWINANGNVMKGFPEVIEGGNWRKVPIGADTYSGSIWDRRGIEIQKNALNMDRAEAERIGAEYSGRTDVSSVLNPIKDFLGFASKNIGAGKWMNNSQATTNYANSPLGHTPIGLKGVYSLNLGGAFMGGLGWEQANFALVQQEIELNARASIASSVLNISTSNFLRELGYNTFYGVVNSYSLNDLLAFDKFLTKYGYNVGNKAFTVDDFYSRPHFNYVKLKSIIMKSNRSMWMRNVAEQQLLRGVRIWHEYPTRGAIEDGNI